MASGSYDRRMHLPLRTEHLVMRAHTMDDLDAWHELFGDPAVVRYLYQAPLSRDEAAEHLSKRFTATLPQQDGEWLMLAMEFDGRCVGDVGVHLVSRENRQCEIGYVLSPRVQGRGLATEAATLITAIAFDELDTHRVCGRLDARNEASARLLERLGMRREGHLRETEWVKGEWTDEVIYAITLPEWRARTSC